MRDQAEKREFEEVVVQRRLSGLLWTMYLQKEASIPDRTSPL